MKEQVDELFEKGSFVEVLANKDDIFNDFIGTVVKYDICDQYDGDPYGDCVPVAVGSNQIIVTEDDSRWEDCQSLAKHHPLSSFKPYLITP